MNVKWLVRWALISLVLAAILTLFYNKVVVPGREKARQAAAEAATPTNPLVEPRAVPGGAGTD
jgi:hypothetical protein